MEDIIAKCPRGKFCSVNICPLDKLSNLRNKLKDEPKCNLAKSIRIRIGTESGLPKKGMSDKEFSFYQSWNNKSEDEKNEVKKRLAKNQFKSKSRINPEALLFQL